jgi:prephenate dehydrogenase/chorismate mutase
MLFENILVIGAGLIGGSYIKAIMELNPEQKMTIVEPHEATRIQLKEQCYKNVCVTLKEVDGIFDLVLIATREEVTATYMAKMPTCLIHDQSIITDLCSTKSRLAKVAKKTMLDTCYIGAHPIFGDVNSGFEHSDSSKIIDSTIVVMNAGRNHVHYVKWKELMCSIGHVVINMDEHDHDLYYANTSHLTHLLAFVQESMLTNKNERLMPPSYKRQSHLSCANRQLWSEIFAFNQESLVHLIDNMVSQMTQFKEIVLSSKASAINHWLEGLNEKEQLDTLRKQIDSIDKNMATLLQNRLIAAKQIGQIKSNFNLAVIHESREKEVYDLVQSSVTANQFDSHILDIYSTIIEKSRLVQER